ncbi:hypothetical protein KOW79_008289 [Hemibagrus wyckioides]|uniref:Saposin B-type domain-containing protein n=1 Tax=Hemibagrus wyckioides TaxID=337641 RepID=A0A9D3NTG5_9TELE|nr:antimicrobial peptide NK-lysin-like [Hemibagrus wyckioides]KAG7328345.1 hypothetical protein KOW79_008289 [Hemibagrus wyckioides]
MLWKLLIASLLISSVCAVHLEYLKIDYAEETLDESSDFVDQDEDLLKSEAHLPGACWACKWAMKKVKSQIGNSANVDTIKEKVMKVCDSIGFLRGVCRKFITKYLDTLTEELSTTDDPKTICQNIGICKSMVMMEMTKAFLKENSMPRIE